jgi:hypothetical protein
VRPGTTIVLPSLLALILGAAVLQLFPHHADLAILLALILGRSADPSSCSPGLAPPGGPLALTPWPRAGPG